MKKKITLILMILVVATSMLPAVDDSVWGNDDFSQKVINLNLVVSDVLYAGFSSKYMDIFMPEFGLLSKEELFSETSEVSVDIRTKPFYIFCLASTKRGVSVMLDYSERFKANPPNPKPGQIGKMGWLENSKDAAAKKIPCELVGAPKMALRVKDAAPKKGATIDDITVAWSYPAPVSGVLMYLRVLKEDIPEDTSADYVTELMLNITVD